MFQLLKGNAANRYWKTASFHGFLAKFNKTSRRAAPNPRNCWQIGLRFSFNLQFRLRTAFVFA